MSQTDTDGIPFFILCTHIEYIYILTCPGLTDMATTTRHLPLENDDHLDIVKTLLYNI